MMLVTEENHLCIYAEKAMDKFWYLFMIKTQQTVHKRDLS